MSLVISEKDNGIGIITFNNPPKGFLTSEMIAETIPMIEDLDNDDSIKTVIFTGGMPGVFIKHFSVEEILAMSAVTKERRKIQKEYNDKHNIIPKSILKSVSKSDFSFENEKLKENNKIDNISDISILSLKEKDDIIFDLNKAMLKASDELKFEKAAKIRDQIKTIRKDFAKDR